MLLDLYGKQYSFTFKDKISFTAKSRTTEEDYKCMLESKERKRIEIVK